MVKAALDYVRAQNSGQEADLLAHSAGGVFARYYCLVTEPSASGGKIDDLVMIAPLHHGSLAAVGLRPRRSDSSFSSGSTSA